MVDAQVKHQIYEAEKLVIIPYDYDIKDGSDIMPGQDCYLKSIKDGTFMERRKMVQDSTQEVHQTGRFLLGFSNLPTQTAQFLSEKTDMVDLNGQMGISYAGMSSQANPLQPTNTLRRTITLRESADMPQTCCTWWYGDEMLTIIKLGFD